MRTEWASVCYCYFLFRLLYSNRCCVCAFCTDRKKKRRKNKPLDDVRWQWSLNDIQTKKKKKIFTKKKSSEYIFVCFFSVFLYEIRALKASVSRKTKTIYQLTTRWTVFTAKSIDSGTYTDQLNCRFHSCLKWQQKNFTWDLWDPCDEEDIYRL